MTPADAPVPKALTRDDWRRAEELFAAVLALPPAARAERLGAAPPAIAAVVAELLLADERAGGFLDEAIARGAEAVVAAELAGRTGERVGPYRLGRLLGSGGAGAVYLATRVDAGFQQEVAIKLVRAGLADSELLGRLRAERQILARLDHPNIARLLDGGSTADGRPFLVMERIEGVAIDRYCDGARLGVAARVRLFQEVCAAVHYAHRNLVVHRDLKPSNVLVTANGVPKLLDFGIAKLLAPELYAETVALTHLGRAMTPAYASPEQLTGEPVTTASDLYSLGVLLYELLAGGRPFAGAEGSPTAFERAVREEEPPPPSVAALAGAERAAQRGERPDSLARTLAGDLDTIVLMALRKEPERRYGSAEQLAEDLQRYLEGRPVIARADTVPYRVGKFVRRHRAAVAGTALAVAGLLAFAFNLALQRERIARERDRAERVSSLLVDLFSIAAPGEGAKLTARELLDHGAQQVQQLDGQPETQAMLLATLAQLYEGLGLYPETEKLLARTLAVREGLDGARSTAVATVLQDLGRAVANGGDYRRAEALFRRALEIRRERLGDESSEVAASRNALGLTLHDLGDFAGAEAQYREAAALDLRLLGEQHRHTFVVRGNLALLLADLGRLAEAERLFAQLGEAAEALPSPDREDLQAEFLDGRGQALTELGDAAGAGPSLAEALRLRRKLLGDEHPLVARTRDHVGRALVVKGDLVAAEAALQEGYAQRLRLLGAEHAEIAESLEDLGVLYGAQAQRQGLPAGAPKLAAAERALRDAIRRYEVSLGGEHAITARTAGELGQVLARAGRCSEAEPFLGRALAHLPEGLTRRRSEITALRESCSAGAERPP